MTILGFIGVYLKYMVMLNAFCTFCVESNGVIFNFEPFEVASLLEHLYSQEVKTNAFRDFLTRTIDMLM